MDGTEELSPGLIPIEYPFINGQRGKYPQPIELPSYNFAAELVREPFIGLNANYTRNTFSREERTKGGEVMIQGHEELYAADNTPLLIVNTTTFPYRTEKESPWHPGVVCDVTLGARTFQISFSNRQTAFLTGPSENGAPREDDESMPRVISTTRGAILFLPERENNLANQGIEDTARQQWGILVDYSKRGCWMVIIDEGDPNLKDDERCWNYNKFTDQMLSFVSPQSFS